MNKPSKDLAIVCSGIFKKYCQTGFEDVVNKNWRHDSLGFRVVRRCWK